MPNNETIIRILLVDDHKMVRQGLIFFLSAQPDFQIVGEASNGVEAIHLAHELRPHVVLMDLVMPVMSGLEAIPQIKTQHPEIEILAVTSFVDDEKVLAAIQEGATGYMMKDATPNEIARAIRSVAQGEMYLHPEAARRLARSLQAKAHPALLLSSLTDRELEVLRLIARGLSNQDIADDLCISFKTVKVHVSSILQKLDLKSRVQVVLYALRHNIVPLDEI
jgi:NarL family two-component system response regulator LiaR